ncbi:MAG: arsenate reductase ArsC [Candidatus Micrarchaeota archaeon]
MKTVLFVCVENARRSQIAEGIFNYLAREKKVDAKALSAGSKPAGKVDGRAVEVMKEVGIDISRAKPKPLTLEMLERADIVITMGCEGVCPATSKAVEEWGIPDPRGKSLEEYRKAREEIRARVEGLLKRLK